MKLTYLMAVSFRSQPAFLPSVACAARNCANPGELTTASSKPSNEAPSPKRVFSRSPPLVAKTRFTGKPLLSGGTRRIKLRAEHADVNGILDRESQLPVL